MKSKITSDEIIEKMKEFCLKKNKVIYLVGGYIRDKILRRKSKDIDFVMEEDALKVAEEFSEMYKSPRPVFYGRFGTAMIEIDGFKLEFATARKESYPEDSRKPFVERAGIFEDLQRRDFTINAIALNLVTGEILDPFNGREDIKKKIIRTPIDPDRTFYDDPLRILRGVRFATKFKFEIEENTLEGMKKNKDRIKIVSEERIADEIMKILECSTPSIGFYLMDEIGILEIILPEISNLKEKRTDHPCKDLFPHVLKTLDNVSKRTKNVYIRLATLLHDIGKPYTLRIENGKVTFHRHEFVGEKMAYKICKRLKIGEENTKFIQRLIRNHLRPHLLAKENPTDRALRRFIREIGKDMKGLFLLAKSDLTSKNELRVKEALLRLENLENRIKEINRKDKLSSFKLAINGFDIMEILKIPPSKKVGVIKEYIEGLVVEKQLPNKKRFLRNFIKENAEKLLSL